MVPLLLSLVGVADAATLTTAFGGTIGTNGNLFDVVATNSVTITDVDVDPAFTGTKTVEVWYAAKPLASASSWTRVAYTPVSVATSGTATSVHLSTPISIPAGSTYALYVTLSSTTTNLYATAGTAVGARAASDTNLAILEGYGVKYSFGTRTSKVAFDGTLTYTYEDCTDGADNDADGDIDCFDAECFVITALCDCDTDGDGYDEDKSACGGDDCDDLDGDVHPGAAEVCDAVDQDCDTEIDEGSTTIFYKDVDADGWGSHFTTKACAAPSGYVSNKLDCDDADPDVHPGEPEVCDTIDNDCDGLTDEGVTTTFYGDGDGDGYGGDIPWKSCSAPSGYVADTTDCDDADASSYPGATEACDGADNDCDDVVDEGVLETYYIDADGDAYGSSAETTTGCSTPSGYAANKSDCDDADPDIRPGAAEICDDVDQDCDTRIDEGLPAKTYYADADVDGYGDAGTPKIKCRQPDGYVADKTDCDDAEASVYPGAPETAYDGVDQDCDGDDLLDLDGDGYDYDALGGDDCVDADAGVHPGVSEAADGVDEDCDGAVDEGTAVFDDDGDGWTEAGGDCDDAEAGVHPGQPEDCDGADEDCDGVSDEGTSCADDDGDGYTEEEGDCVDSSADVSPAADELADNGIDDDCDGATDFGIDDRDDDGYTASLGADCDDGDPVVFPGATEILDGVDDDCDGRVDEGTEVFDDDGDGQSERDGDCDDADAAISSAGIEADNGRDDDCDGRVDEGTRRTDDDRDGFSEEGGDCDDADPAVHPGVLEIENARDDDCDGYADEGLEDRDADGWTAEEGDCDDEDGWRRPGLAEQCDGADNDCDGAVDEDVCVTITEDTDEPPVVRTGDAAAGGCASAPGGGWLGLLAPILARRGRRGAGAGPRT